MLQRVDDRRLGEARFGDAESGDAGNAASPHARHDAQVERFEWISRRNCSLAPSQLAVLLAIPAGVSLAIATYFVFVGTWWMLLFASIETAGLAAAFVVYARHAGAYERISLTPERLLVELHSGSRTFRAELPPGWTQIVFPCARITGFRSGPLVELRHAGRTLSLGRFAMPAQRAALAGDLRRRLHGVRASGGNDNDESGGS
ncbi:MAG: DUF2244 domain-containing protein [Lautropia sp.]